MRINFSKFLIGMKQNHRHLLGALLMGIAYWALASYSGTLAALAGGYSYIWPADGLALGVLLCTRVRFWPLYLLCAFVGNLVTSNAPPLQNLLYALFNVLEPAVVAWMVISLLGVQPRINNVKSVLVVIMSIVGVMALATLLASYVHNLFYQKALLAVWISWYVADMLGMLVVGLLVVCVSCEWRSHWENLSSGRLWEATGMLAGLIVITHLMFAIVPYQTVVSLNLSSTPLIGPGFFMLWAAIRFGLAGAVISVAILALQTFWYTASGVGPLARLYPDTASALLHLQALLALADFIALTAAAVSAERRQAHLDSNVARKRLEFAIEASDMLVFEAEPATQKLFWSGNTMDVLGRTESDITNIDDWWPFIHDEDRDWVKARYAELSSGLINSATLDYRVRFEGGEWMWLGVSAYAVPVKERWLEPAHRKTRVIGFMKNVTAKRRMDEEKRVLEEQLRHSAKMEAIGGLAGGIAHDFNNILGAILGYAEMAQAHLPPGTDVRRYVDTIASAGERGKALVSQILTFSRVNHAEVHPVEIKMLVAEVMSTLKGFMPANVRVTEAKPEGNLFVLGNATHLYQLVMNLSGNAVQAMPSGGELKVSLNVIDNAVERVLQGGVLACGKFITLEIEDQGVGISQEVLPRIFEPFFTTKSREKGTGLGLAIVHGVVLSHGGAIEVQSTPGKGTKFTVYLPEYAVQAGTELDTRTSIHLGNGESILVVDDEPAMVALAEDLLAQLGYEPLGFTSSVEALAAYLAAPASFDALMTDEVMPELTGTQLSQKIREANASLPILIVSGFVGAGFESRAKDAGVALLLKKPYQKEELAVAMGSLFLKDKQ